MPALPSGGEETRELLKLWLEMQISLAEDQKRLLRSRIETDPISDLLSDWAKMMMSASLQLTAYRRDLRKTVLKSGIEMADAYLHFLREALADVEKHPAHHPFAQAAAAEEAEEIADEEEAADSESEN